MSRRHGRCSRTSCRSPRSLAAGKSIVIALLVWRISIIEINLDGLVGPTHHFGGLALGNVASQIHAGMVSHPKRAALEGIAKMRLLASRGIPQGFLPPSPRPNLSYLQLHGFDGPIQEVLANAAEEAPHILSAAYSSAFMWTANAATVTPSSDSSDGRLHLTVANLISNLHRAQESSERFALLGRIFARCPSAQVHPPLPSCWPLRDEGAANQMRLSGDPLLPGLEIFVFGEEPSSVQRSGNRTSGRQGYEASKAVARFHRLPPGRALFLQQNPKAIDAGVFHNDVIATSHENMLVYHEEAFVDADSTMEQLSSTFRSQCKRDLCSIPVSSESLTLEESVSCYLFNSQIVTIPNLPSEDRKRFLWLAPKQCQSHPKAKRLLDRWVDDPEIPIAEVLYHSLEESMANGGGPACLRLRLNLTDSQMQQIDPAIWLTNERADALEHWIEERYPDQCSFRDFIDPNFAMESLDTYRDLLQTMGW